MTNDAFRLERDDRKAALSPREEEVLSLVSLGLTNTEIVRRLRVSVHGVKFHLHAVYRKLGVSNRTQAALVYLHPSGRSRSSA